MPRPKKTIPPAKTQRISIRLTEDEYEILCKNARTCQMTPSAYIRNLIVGKIPKPAPILFFDDSALIDELRKLGKMANNINQIARYFNEGGLMTNPLATEIWKTLGNLESMIIRCGQMMEDRYTTY